jgi:hypothetical protein
VGVLNLGYPLWLLVAVLVVLGLLTFYVLRGRVSDRMLLPLTVVLTPVCAVLVVAIAVFISSLLSPFYEPPSDGLRKEPQKTPAATSEPTAPETTAPSASPTASPSGQILDLAGSITPAPSSAVGFWPGATRCCRFVTRRWPPCYPGRVIPG